MILGLGMLSPVLLQQKGGSRLFCLSITLCQRALSIW